MARSKKSLRMTKKNLKGYDRSTGKVVRRTIYEDSDGMRYVALGSYAPNNRDACVPMAWFCKRVFDNQYLITEKNTLH